MLIFETIVLQYLNRYAVIVMQLLKTIVLQYLNRYAVWLQFAGQNKK